MSVGWMMNIGEAAQASGVSAKMIRYYESIDLIPPASRSDAGYRHYTPSEVQTLRFIHRARDLGFAIDAIRRLLALWRDRARSSAEVKQVALDHVAELKHKIVELQQMVGTLEHLAHHCHGDDRPECPIIDELAASTEALLAVTRLRKDSKRGSLTERRIAS